MNKTKKNLLTASSILAIIGFAGTIICAAFMFLFGAVCSEQLIKESYLEDGEYVYEIVDDTYQFVPVEFDDEIVTEKDIEEMAILSRCFFYASAITMLGFSVAKFVLALKVLLAANKNQYKKGCTIALLALSLLNSNLVESVLLIIAICLSDKQANENKEEFQQIKLEDIQIEK